MESRKKLITIIQKDSLLMNLLKLVRTLNLPDWYIAAGAIRNTIWDYFHRYAKKTPLNDVDVIYFDESDLSSKKDALFERKLQKARPGIKWNVFNQARAHIRDKKRKKAKSSEEGMAYWSETPTCIGIRLNNNNSFTICAPHGISDLMNLKVRPSPPPYTDLNLFKKRVKEKRWKEIWPKLKISSS